MTPALLQIAVLALFVQSVSIDGSVVESGSGIPISKASVELRLSTVDGRVAPVTTTTQSDGRFIFRNVPAGEYQVVATRPAYLQRRAVTVKAGDRPVNVTVAMTPTAAVSGRVTDHSGKPLGNVIVQALKASYENGRREVKVIKAGRTNDLGEYRIFWLPSGVYYVNVLPAGASAADKSFIGVFTSISGNHEDPPPRPSRTPPQGGGENETDLPTYYPATPDIAAASVIELGPGADLPGLDIRVVPVRTFRVRGVIQDDNTRRPLASEQIRLLSPVNGYTLVGRAISAADGSFTIPNVPPGSYVLLAKGNGVSGRVPVEVSSADVEVFFALGPGSTLPGKLTVEGQPELTGRLRVAVNLDPPVTVHWDANGLVSVGGLIVDLPNSRVAADGSFTLNNVPKGDLRVVVIEDTVPLRTSYIKSIRLGGADILAGGLRIDRQPESQLEITIGTDVGFVDGRVVDARLQPLADVRVALLPEPASRSRTDLYKIATTDASGRFRIEGIAPDNYKLFAWEEVEDGAWLDPRAMRFYEDRGMSIRIAAGSKQTVALPVIPLVPLVPLVPVVPGQRN
jgi:5-hydroxyisourate hydrolase-like protein (transthyretin family)